MFIRRLFFFFLFYCRYPFCFLGKGKGFGHRYDVTRKQHQCTYGTFVFQNWIFNPVYALTNLLYELCMPLAFINWQCRLLSLFFFSSDEREGERYNWSLHRPLREVLRVRLDGCKGIHAHTLFANGQKICAGDQKENGEEKAEIPILPTVI